MKPVDRVPLSKLSGGINRFTPKDDQAIEALDVWLYQGIVTRRPSFKAVATNAPFYLPAGCCYVAIERLSDNVFTTEAASRKFSFTASNKIGGSTYRLWIGSTVQFDGFSWDRLLTLISEANFTQNAKLYIRYLATGGVLTPVYNAVDSTTKKNYVNSTTEYYVALTQNGRVSWNKNFFDSWTAQTKPTNGGTRYWIAVDIALTHPQVGETTTATDFPFSSGTHEIGAQAIRVFLLNPVNGLMASKSKGLAPVLLAGSDFRLKRGYVPGGGLGLIRRFEDETEIARLVEDEGSGKVGATTMPTWAGGSTTWGTADQIVKDRTDYDWAINQFDGPALFSISPLVGGTLSSIHCFPSWEGGFEQNVEGLRAYISAQPGPGGPALGEEREIVSASSSSISIYPDWSAALSGNETIEIRMPPSFVRTHEYGVDYEIESNTATNLVIHNATFSPGVPATNLQDKNVNFEIFKQCFWCMQPGRNWCFVFDSSSRNVIATNGENGLFEWDGVRLRRLEALWDGTDGVPGAPIVQLWRGHIADFIARTNPGASVEAGSQLHRFPPNGKYIIDYMGRLVVANIRDREQTIQWSAPGAANNLWPLTYETIVRDSENGPITGLATLYDRLVVFTSTAIFVADPPGADGMIYLRPIVQGVGCVSHFAIAKISLAGASVLIFPGPDGIYIFDGHSCRAILPDWEQLIDGGANDRCLYNTAGAAWLQRNHYFLAFPSRGSDVNDRIAVIDYSSFPETRMWLWSAPTHEVSADEDVVNDITAICRDLDESGRERVLFGHRDGHISELEIHGFRDGGEAITGWARSKPYRFEEMIAASAVQLDLKAMGSTPSITLRSYLSRSDRPANSQSKTLESVSIDSVYGTDRYNTTGDQYAAAPIRSYVFNLPNQTIGEMYDFEIRGTERFEYEGGFLLYSPKGQRSG